MKITGSLKFVLSVLTVILVVWLGWKGYGAFQLRNVTLDPIEPGRINVMAISPASGYRIVVANQVAYLAKYEGGEEEHAMASGSESLANASRLPLRELIQTLQGDEKALGPLVMRLNEWADTDTSLYVKVWKQEDILEALNGNEEKRRSLENDLNVTLEGKPLPTINVGNIVEGIMIDSPVTMDVQVGGVTRTLTGRVQELYQPQFCREVETEIDKEFNPSDAAITGIYREIAQQMQSSNKHEDVARSLQRKIDPARLAGLTEPVNKVLKNTVVLLNESHIEAARFENYEIGANKTTNDIHFDLTNPGRLRLWKYSRENTGFQLLFVVDSIAISAPRVKTELPEKAATIRQVPSKRLVADAVELLNEIIKEKT